MSHESSRRPYTRDTSSMPHACMWGQRTHTLTGHRLCLDAVVSGSLHTLALADNGSVHVWGGKSAAEWGLLGLGPSVSDAGNAVPTPQRIPGLRAACGL
jgi:alpha-tubulin suppressor-like RCC1 family protein